MSQSIYQQVMGEEFEKLHPKIQERFGFSSVDCKRAIGIGKMDRVWHGLPYTIPFLYVGTLRHIMFPEQGKDVEFTIENWSYVDDLGRETVTEIRTFHLKKKRRFDGYMVRHPEKNQIVDLQGTHQHLAIDLHLSAAENGDLESSPKINDFMNRGFLSASPCSSLAKRVCLFGLMIRLVGTRSKLTCGTSGGDRYLDLRERLMSIGRRCDQRIFLLT